MAANWLTAEQAALSQCCVCDTGLLHDVTGKIGNNLLTYPVNNESVSLHVMLQTVKSNSKK